jgi:uncharacterized protein DUF1416
MPTLNGIVASRGEPADGAYVQVLSLDGEFQGEVRTNEKGAFKLYPSAGTWRLVSWSPGHEKVERQIQVAEDDVEISIDLQ